MHAYWVFLAWCTFEGFSEQHCLPPAPQPQEFSLKFLVLSPLAVSLALCFRICILSLPLCLLWLSSLQPGLVHCSRQITVLSTLRGPYSALWSLPSVSKHVVFLWPSLLFLTVVTNLPSVAISQVQFVYKLMVPSSPGKCVKLSKYLSEGPLTRLGVDDSPPSFHSSPLTLKSPPHRSP